MKWMITNSLWLVGLALMAASAGLDGAYMARMMPSGAGWAGYTLNAASDVAGLVLMFWFGRLRQSPKNSKRYRLALALLPAEIVTTGYAWFFSWRQLLLVLPAVEGLAARWVAPVSAGFIPLLLAFVGFAQALLTGRLEGAGAVQRAVMSGASDSAAELEAVTSGAKSGAGTLSAVMGGTEAVLEAGPVAMSGTEAVQERSLTVQERIEAVLEADPGATGAEIRARTGCSESYARKVKRSVAGHE